MPELPDVEKYRYIAAQAAGQAVRRVSVPDPGVLEGTTPQGLGRSLRGRVVADPERHGKWLILRTRVDGPSLVCHFGMTGSLHWVDDGGRANDDADGPGHAAVVLGCDRGVLTYRTHRRLGKVAFLRPGQDHRHVTGELGPDATEVDRDALERLLAHRRGGLKSALLDQEVIAGLGNELIDETLWRSRIHPRRAAAHLDASKLDDLHHALGEVLREAIAAGQVPSEPGWLNAQRADPEPRCPRCSTKMRRATVGGRTTLWCPHEQPDAS